MRYIILLCRLAKKNHKEYFSLPYMANREEVLRFKFPFRNGVDLLITELFIFNGLILRCDFSKI